MRVVSFAAAHVTWLGCRRVGEQQILCISTCPENQFIVEYITFDRNSLYNLTVWLIRVRRIPDWVYFDGIGKYSTVVIWATLIS